LLGPCAKAWSTRANMVVTNVIFLNLNILFFD
jgi:hypothetical protein